MVLVPLLLLMIAASSVALDGQAEGQADGSRPQLHALLLNGGGSAAKNYLSHLHHLQDMVAALRQRGLSSEQIHVFTSDGEDPGKDLAGRGREPDSFWLVEGTSAGQSLDVTDLSSTAWEGVPLRPARLAELRRWFVSMREKLRTGDTLLVFVTDHGTRNAEDPDNGLISLWNETMSVLEFRALLGHLVPGVHVVCVMSQCFSGAFAEAMTPFDGRLPSGDVCGFYATTRDRPAYGCYPEGRDRDRLGHAFRFIDAMSRHGTFADVHGAALVTDTTPDVPIRTSDLFLERVLQDEAAERKLSPEELADQQLALAWRNRGAWEPTIRLLDRIGEVYGTFSPRTLAELKPRLETLQSLSDELETYEDRWELALDDLRKDNLERFLEQNPAWKERLEAKALANVDATGRRSLLLELLPALEAFTKERTEIWTRLQTLLGTDSDARTARYRVDTRLAALLRMKALLVRIAGVQLLEGSDPAPERRAAAPHRSLHHRPPRKSIAIVQPRAGVIPRERRAPAAEPYERGERAAAPSTRRASWKRALEALEACETSTIGSFDSHLETAPAAETPERLPPFEEDLAAVRRALPSWLGVRFRPVPETRLARLEVERGAVVVEQIVRDAPASTAGVRLGDILLGPPGKHFAEPNQIREWTMTSPRDTPTTLDVLRDGETMQVTVSLAAYPTRLPAMEEPPGSGDEAPPLGALTVVRSAAPGAPLPPGGHMLFFWATWCVPCKNSVPELLAWSRKTGVPVLAVTDEDEDVVRKFLESWKDPFPDFVVSDEVRRLHLSYGVSGTPTFVLVDDRGKISWRHVGYSRENGLDLPGWSWSPAAPAGILPDSRPGP